jgi:hypothetical protein
VIGERRLHSADRLDRYEVAVVAIDHEQERTDVGLDPPVPVGVDLRLDLELVEDRVDFAAYPCQ